MPLFMDRHDIAGVTAKAVLEAHELDMAVQDKHGVNYLTYWLDEPRGRIFCLCDAPTKELAEQVHREAHGLVANHIMEVDPETVEAFLGTVAQVPKVSTMMGRLDDTQAALAGSQGSSGFRVILFTDMQGSTALTRELGDARAMEVLRTHNGIVREAVASHGGREVKHTGDGFMISFLSASRAVECSMAILQAFAAFNERNPESAIHVRLGLTAGEPVEENQDLFGTSVQLAARLCAGAKTNSILVSGAVHDLCLGKKLPFSAKADRRFKGFDRPIRVHEVDWTQA
jgi:class 3 adenylate cyclase